MTLYQPTAEQLCTCDTTQFRRPRWWTVLAGQLAASAVYVVAVPIGGVDLEARVGDTTPTIDLGTVLGASLVVGVLAVAWLVVVQRVSARPERAWAVSATVVLVLSLVGPAGATNIAAGLTLACMHLAVGGALAVGTLTWHRTKHG